MKLNKSRFRIICKHSKVWINLCFLLICASTFILEGQENKKKKPCKNCFTANYRDVEINEWLKTMSTLIGKNILIDENVKGKITIVSNEEIPIRRALDFMKQVLEVRNFSVIEEPYLLKIVPTQKKIESADPVGKSRNISGIITKILQIPESLNLNEVVSLIKGLAGSNVSVVTYNPTNSIILTGYNVKVNRVIKIFSRLIKELNAKRRAQRSSKDLDTVHIYKVRYVNARDLAAVLGRLSLPSSLEKKGNPNAPATNQAAPKIEAVSHKESNSLVVTANNQDWAKILPIIQQLDNERSQILLEVLIAEITSANINDFGIDWRVQGANGASGQFNSGLAASGGLLDSTGQPTGNNTLSGFSLGFIQAGGNLTGVLSANIDRQNFKVLSSPQILAMDNEQSELSVGQDIPVRTQERTSGGGTSETTINSFEYRNAGITLRVTPHINPSRQISINLFGEITSVLGSAESTANPTFTKRNITTNVLVNDKQTIVLGGLISSQDNKLVRKVPGLSEIPLLGFLFRRTNKSTSRTNLMIFITPHIIDTLDVANRITDQKRQTQIKATLESEKPVILWPDKYSEDK